MMEPTLERMRALKLNAMVTAWLAQRTDSHVHELDFDARLALLVEAETLSRDNKRLQKLLYDAKLRIPSACIEDLDFSAKRELDRGLVRQLAVGGWSGERQNVIVTGPTGVVPRMRSGAALLPPRPARALQARAAPLRGTRARPPDGSYTRLLTRFAKTDVLILDDWGLVPLNDQQRRDVLEVLEDLVMKGPSRRKEQAPNH